MKYALIITHVGAVAAFVFGTYVYAIEAWMAPFSPVLYFIAFELFLLVLFSPFWFFTTKAELDRGIGGDGMSAEERGFERLTHAVGHLVLSLSAVSILFVWAIPHFRALVIDTPKSTRYQLHVALADDPSDRVATAACRRIYVEGESGSRLLLRQLLRERPKVATKCLIGNDGAGARLMASQLSRRWIADVASAGIYEAKEKCGSLTQSRAIANALSESLNDSLMQCVLGGETEEGRSCCAEASPRLDFPDHMFEERYGTLADKMFEAEMSGVLPPINQILEFGCDRQETSPDLVYETHARLSTTAGCGPIAKAFAHELPASQFCEMVYRRTPSSASEVCSAIDAALQNAAVEEAQDRLMHAAKLYHIEKSAKEMADGMETRLKTAASRQRERRGTEPLANFIGGCHQTVYDTVRREFVVEEITCPQISLGDALSKEDERRKQHSQLIRLGIKAKNHKRINKISEKL